MRKNYSRLIVGLFGLLLSVFASAQVSVTATAGTTGPTAYADLSSAFTAINAGTHQGAITIDITASFTDAAVAVLNSSGAGAAIYTSVLIRPTADGVTMSLATATGRGVIELNGADNVTIDGDNPNTGGTNRNLTITNTATNLITFTSCIRLATSTLVTSCDNVTIKNCNLNGSGTGRNTAAFTAEVTTWGIISSAGASTAAATTAPNPLASATTPIPSGQTNTNLLIDNNNIQVAARGISVNGSSTTVSPGLLITNNIVGNSTVGAVDQVTAVGITVQGTANGIVRGNTVRVEGFVGSSTSNRAINLGMVSTAGVTGVTIERNTVGIINNNTGTWTAAGIDISGGNNDIIQNNFVLDCLNNQVAGSGAFSTTFGAFGIRINAGTGHKILHNSVHFSGAIPGSLSTDLVTCLAIVSTTSTGLDIRNNIFSNKATGGNTVLYNTLFPCIFLPSAATSAMALTLNNNAYLQGSTPQSGIAHVGTTAGATTFYLSGNFNPGTTTPTNNLRNYTSTLSVAGTNDNASLGLNISASFVSNTDLHIPNGTLTPLESTGAAAGVTTDFDGQVRSVATPDIGADEFTGIFADVIPPLISYAPLGIICTGGDRTLTGVTITDASGVPTVGALVPRIYYRKNAGAYFSQPGSLSSGTGTNGVWSFNIVAADMGGLVLGDVVSYYIIAQDVATPANISSNPPGVVATSVNSVTTPPASPNSYPIGGSIGGTYTVGVGGNYTTLTAAATAYNTSCLSAAVIFNLIDATYPSETFPITFNQNGTASAVNTLTIKPATTATVSGVLNNGALIRILGNYITINGSNTLGTSRDLTITNTSTTAPSVLLIGSAGTIPVTNSGVRNTIIINGTNTASAVVVSDVTLGTAGYFNNITLQNNSVQRAFIGMYNIAVVAPGNGSGLLVTGNDLSTSGANSIRLACIYVQGVDGATVSNNTIGNVANTLDASNLTGIWFATGTVNSSITGNNITNFSGTSTAPRGIAISSAVTGSNINIANNTISGLTSSSTITTTGIFIFSTTAGVTVQKNTISNIKNTNSTGFGSNGIQLSSTLTAAAVNVSNNFISDIAAVGFALMGVGDNGYGIIATSGGGYNIDYNTVNMNTDQTAVGGLPAAMNITSGVTTAASINIRNNIFANNQTVGTQRYSILSSAANTVFGTIDYNDYSTSGANLGFIGVNRVDLAAIQAGFGGNANSINVAPAFVSATDLHLVPATNAGINNRGTVIAGITTDIDNNTRSTSVVPLQGPDPGADEFVGPCTGAVGGTATGNATFCGPGTPTIAATGYSDGIGIGYQWQSSSDNFVSNIVDIPGQTNPATLTTGVVATTTYYRLKVTCPTGVATDFSNTITITISLSPTATISYTPSAMCLYGSPVAVTFTGVSGGTYSAAPGGLTIDPVTGTVTPATSAPNTYVVTYDIAASGACPAFSTTTNVTVNPTPTVNPVANQTLCAGTLTTAVNFTGGVPGTVFNWTNNTTSIGLAAAGSGNIAAFTALNAGAVPVTATITVTPSYTNAGGTCTGTPVIFTITVNPNATITAQPVNATICAGGNTTFSVTAINASSYQWQISTTGAGGPWTSLANVAPFSNVTTPILAITGAGNVYNGNFFRVVVTGTCGAINSNAVSLTVNPLPTVNAGPSGFCSPVTITASGNANTYTWAPAAGLNTTTGPVVIATTTTTTVYTVTGTITATGCQNSASVTVNGTPSTPVITPAAPVICAGTIQPLSVPGTLSTFTGGPVTIPAGAPGTTSGIGSPYPSVINVSGLPAVGVKVKQVIINGISHTFPEDMDILLRSPAGFNVILMSDIGGGTDLTGQTYTFDDAAIPSLGTGLNPTGTYKPTNLVGALGVEPDNWPLPGPGTVSQTNPTLSTFTGNANGGWSLYIVDDAGGDVGAITGWSIVFEIQTAIWTPVTGLFSDPLAQNAYVAGTPASTVYFLQSPLVTTQYTYTVINTLGTCSSGPATVTVTVNPVPVITVAPNNQCTPVTLTASGNSNGYTWSPNYGLSATTGATVTATPPLNTTYTVTGTLTGTGCTAAATVTVNATPAAPVITPSAVSLCVGGVTILTAAPTAVTSRTTGPISIPAGAPAATSGNASPYPSTLNIGGLPVNGARVKSVNINGITHTFPGDIDMVLVAPNGQASIIMSDAGGGNAVNNVNLVFDDGAATILPAAITSGTWRPTNTAGPDNFPAPGPGNITDVGPRLSNFTGNMNGNWNLYIVDQFAGDFGSITSWSITFEIIGAVWTPVTGLFTDPTYTTPYVAGTIVSPVYVKPTATTTYTATRATATCTSAATNVTVTVIQPLVITTQPASQTVCQGANVTFSVAFTGGTPSYQWQISTNGGGTFTNIAGANNPTLVLPNVATTLNGNQYRVVMTNTCSSITSAAATLTVNATSLVTIGSLPTRICISDTAISLIPLGQPAGGSWTGIGVSGTNFVPGATAVGTYTLTYTYTNAAGCTTSGTILAKVEDCAERIRLLRDDAVLLFPNPNNGRFNIKINSTLYNYLNMKVFTSNGRLVRNQEFGGLTYGRVINIDLTTLPADIYMVKFYYKDGARTAEKAFKVVIGGHE